MSFDSLDSSPGIFLLRRQAQALGALLARRLGGRIFSPWLDDSLSAREQFAACYQSRRQWVLVMASGIAVRFLDGLLREKTSDPAVVVLDEGGCFAISLLGGHEGGANRLAFQVANAVGASPVVTTASEAVKPLVLGIGCRKGVDVGRIEEAVLCALGSRNLSEVREVATIELKCEEPGLLEFCARHQLPLRWFSQESLAQRSWVTAPSSWVRQNLGVDGVCEPCALMSCARGSMLVPKTVQGGVAVAVVEDNARLWL